MGRPKRPSLLTAESQKEIIDALELSVPLKHAAEAAGIKERTVHDWLERGEAGEQPYAEFYAAVSRARSKAVRNLTGRALAGGRGSHQAMWFLERRYREHYGPIQRIEHAGHDGKAIEITAKAVHEMSDEELERELKRLSGDSERALPPGT